LKAGGICGMNEGMNIFALAGIGIGAALAAMFLRDGKLPALALLTSLTAGIIIFLSILPQIGQIFQVFEDLAQKANLSGLYLTIVFKVLGIAYVAEFSSQLCRDAGQGSIALKIELAAKTAILLLSLPVMISILNSVMTLFNA
jgi:stage III sporulation protein AD